MDGISELDQACAECKSRCFVTLFGNLTDGLVSDAQAQQMYRNCIATCKRAKELAEAVEP